MGLPSLNQGNSPIRDAVFSRESGAAFTIGNTRSDGGDIKGQEFCVTPAFFAHVRPGQMLPCFALRNGGNVGDGNVEFRGNLPPMRARSNHSDNSFRSNFREFRIVMAFSQRAALAVNHVARIVGMRAKPKMQRVDAMANVARMQNTQQFRDWTVKFFPKPSVSRNVFRGSEGEPSVAAAGNSSSPKNTAGKVFAATGFEALKRRFSHGGSYLQYAIG